MTIDYYPFLSSFLYKERIFGILEGFGKLT